MKTCNEIHERLAIGDHFWGGLGTAILGLVVSTASFISIQNGLAAEAMLPVNTHPGLNPIMAGTADKGDDIRSLLSSASSSSGGEGGGRLKISRTMNAYCQFKNVTTGLYEEGRQGNCSVCKLQVRWRCASCPFLPFCVLGFVLSHN